MNTENETRNSTEILEHAMLPIIDEMFKNGPEEGCRLLQNYSHPLNEAIQILLRAKVSVFEDTPKALALREELKKGEPSASFLEKLREVMGTACWIL